MGDSPAYVYREKLGSVQELTYGAHEGATRCACACVCVSLSMRVCVCVCVLCVDTQKPSALHPPHPLPHSFRNPEHAPGCLGYAIGEEPDLGNMTASITWLQEGERARLRASPLQQECAARACPSMPCTCTQALPPLSAVGSRARPASVPPTAHFLMLIISSTSVSCSCAVLRR